MVSPLPFFQGMVLKFSGENTEIIKVFLLCFYRSFIPLYYGAIIVDQPQEE